MDKELLRCLVCKGCFDDSQHVPVALPACGHTFCRLCLVRMRDNSGNSAFQCPTCRKEHREPAPENLPCNWVILNLLNTSHQPKEEDEQSRKTQDNDEQSKKTRDNDEQSKKTQDNDDDPSNNKMPPSDSSNESKVWKGVRYGLAATAGAACLVAAAPVALTVAGFTSTGIAGGSLAASMMSSAAIANGGGVAAGSLVAVLQSAGAAGIGATATTGLASAGALVGAGTAKIFNMFKSKDDEASHAGAGKSYKTDDDDGKGDDKNGKVDDKDSEVFGKGDDDKDSSGDEDDTCWQG